MIRAVLRDGVFVPLDPLPLEWLDGEIDLVVSSIEKPSARNGVHVASEFDTSEVDVWSRELDSMGVTAYEPGEREMIDQALDAADSHAKQEVRRQMGMP